MSNPHPHEKVIVAYYRGETIQQYNTLTGEWDDWQPYDLRWLYQRPPVFSPDISYRVKPTTVGFTLDMEEIETLWAVLQYVGGDPQTTARRHVDSILHKLEGCISEERSGELHEWGGIEDFDEPIVGFKISANLP